MKQEIEKKNRATFETLNRHERDRLTINDQMVGTEGHSG